LPCAGHDRCRRSSSSQRGVWVAATVNTKLSTDLDVDNTVSFEAWVHPDVNNVEQMLACLRADGTGWRFGIGATGKICFHFGSSGGFQNAHAVSTTTVGTAGYHHLVVTYDGTTVRYYLDGQPDGTASVSTNLAFTGGAFDLGRYGGFSSGYLNGRLQDVAVYTTTLSAARVLAHYDEGKGNILQLPPVAGTIDVAGLAPTVTVDTDVAPPVADVTVGGLDATVQVDSNATIDTPVADVLIEGLSPNVGTGGSINISAVAVAGVSPDVIVRSPQKLRPDADMTGGNSWYQVLHGSGGFYSCVDGVVAVDDYDWLYAPPADWIYGNEPPTNLYYTRVALSGAEDPIRHDGHILRVRYKMSGATPPVTTAELVWGYAGGSDQAVVATRTLFTSSSWTTASFTLTTSEAAKIGDYNELRVRLKAFYTYSTHSQAHINWVELEVGEPGAGLHVQVDADAPNLAVAGLGPTIGAEVVTGDQLVLASTGVVSVAGLVPGLSTGVDNTIAVTAADVSVVGRSPDVFTPGSVNLGVDVVDVVLDVLTGVEITADRTIDFLVETVDVTCAGPFPSVRTGPDSVSFRFIPDYYTGMTALDAQPMSGLNFGPLLHGQIKYLRFRLGNESLVTTHFTIRTVSTNPGVTEMVGLSPDNVLYTPSVTIESVPGNGVTDVVWLKITTSADAFLGEGNFQIEVEQTVA